MSANNPSNMYTCSITDIQPLQLQADNFEHLNWDQLGLETMESRVVYMAEDTQCAEFQDVEFHVGNDKVILRSSKFLLSLRLEYFQEMFARQSGVESDIPDEEEWKPEEQDGKEMQMISRRTIIEYPLLEPTAFKRVLHFLCHGEPHDFTGKENDIDYIFQVKDIAHAIRYHELIKVCEVVLDKSSFGTTEDAIINIDRAFSNPNPDGMDLKKCFSYIHRYGQQIIQSERFLTVTQQTIFKLLMLDLLKEDELTIWDAALRFHSYTRWARHQMALSKTDVTEDEGMAIRNVLGSAINEIRFPLMTAEQIVEVARSTKVLTSREVVELVMYVNGMPCTPTPFKTSPRVAVSDYVCN